MKKRIVSILMVLLMLCMATVPSFATAGEAKIILESAGSYAGGECALNVVLENNPGIAGMRLFISYDASYFTLKTVNDAGLLGSQSHSDNKSGNPYTLYWSNGTAQENFTANGTVVTLVFEVDAETPAGNYTFGVAYNAADDDIIDKDMHDVSFATQNAEVTISEEIAETPAEDFTYSLVENGILIKTYDKTAPEVNIPASIEVEGQKYPVTAIDESAFEENETITSVIIPYTVKAIGDYTFYDCTSLVKVVVNGNPTIGECALGYYYISRKEDGVVEGFKLYGYPGSTAQTYAGANEGIMFVMNEIKGFRTLEGASVRITSADSGIRFMTEIDAKTYHGLVETFGKENIETGTLITPKVFVDEAGEFTAEALDAYKISADKSSETYCRIISNNSYEENAKSYVFAGSLINIKDNHYDLLYSGIGYIKINGIVIYSTDYSSRTIKNVANSALNDVNSTNENGYIYKIEDGINKDKYSLYNAAQRAILTEMINK